MKVLLTIDEYRERIIDLTMKTVQATVLPTAEDWLKFDIIDGIVKKCITDDYMTVDQCNQMFLRVFGCDRDGNRLTEENIKRITKKEADEFNRQEWYAKNYEEKQKKCEASWRYRISPSEDVWGDEYFTYLHDVIRIAQSAFTDDINTKYHISNEVFNRLYGHEFEWDRGFKVEHA